MFNKKMILMLVLLTAVVVSAASAAEYKVYGKLHSSINMLNDSENSRMSLSSNTSRFGIKGSQEINENFSFIWQFEQKLNIAQITDSNASKLELANRNSFIGLTGDWGTFFGGIHDTPYKTLGRKGTFFFDELGDFRQVAMGWDLRLGDVIAYASPNFDGFGVTAAYQFDQTNKLTSDDPDTYEPKTAFSANAIYSKDALLVGAAVENHSKGYTGTEKTEMGIRGVVKYTMDKLAVGGLFQSLSDVGGDPDVTASTFGLEAKYQFDPKFAFKGAYYLTNPFIDAVDDDATGDVDESDVSYSLLALGIDHTVAKNLGFYAQYVMVMNGAAADHGLGGGAHGTTLAAPGAPAGESAAGNDVTGFSFGSWFTF